MRWLVSEWASRDPESDIEDIEGGKYLQALNEVPQSVRMLLEDSDMHVEIKEIDDRFRVVSIVAKRHPELSVSYSRQVKKTNAEDTSKSGPCFFYDKEGNRISLSEDQFNNLLELNEEKEDFYQKEQQGELEREVSPGNPARDNWDKLFDAKNYVQTVKRLIEDDNWQLKPFEEKAQDVKNLENEMIFSGYYFPLPKDKRLKTKKAKFIAKKIEEGLTKEGLIKLIGRYGEDNRRILARAIKTKALKMPLGKERARMLIKSQVMLRNAITDEKKNTKKDILLMSERWRLWELWNNKQMQEGNVVSIPYVASKNNGFYQNIDISEVENPEWMKEKTNNNNPLSSLLENQRNTFISNGCHINDSLRTSLINKYSK